MYVHIYIYIYIYIYTHIYTHIGICLMTGAEGCETTPGSTACCSPPARACKDACERLQRDLIVSQLYHLAVTLLACFGYFVLIDSLVFILHATALEQPLIAQATCRDMAFCLPGCLAAWLPGYLRLPCRRASQRHPFLGCAT